MGKTITSKDYDDRIVEQGLQFQVDRHYEPKTPSSRRRIDAIMKALSPKPGERILDIGCGVGAFTYRCASAGASPVGIDYSPESIKAARTLCAKYGAGEKARFIVADGKAIPFENSYFDKIVAADFIEHITDEDKCKVLGEIKRLLKPGGIAVIFTPNGTRESIGSIYRHIQHALFGKKIPTTDLHFGLTTKTDFERLCRERGLSFRLSYEDTTRPYLARLPFIRRFLALNLLWVLKKDEIRSILAVNLGGVGDVLLSTPALRALKAAYPSAAITSMVVPRAAEILERTGYADEVVTFSTSFKDCLSGLWKLLRLRRRRFDVAMNMRTIVSRFGALKIKFIFDIIDPAVKAGRDTGGLGYFFDIKIPETLIGQKPEMEYDLDIARSLGAEADGRQIDFAIDEDSSARVRELLKREGLGEGSRLIVIHPGGKPSRRWPIENYASLIDGISAGISCKFMITGSRDEAGLGRYLASASSGAVKNFCGELSIAELGALIKMCDLFIVGDTGPMHIAAALGTPLISFFGPGDIVRFDPRNVMPDATVFYKKAPCSPCNKDRCDDRRCLRAITTQEAVGAALDKLRKSDEREKG